MEPFDTFERRFIGAALAGDDRLCVFLAIRFFSKLFARH
jgi:hypothetical protein